MISREPEDIEHFLRLLERYYTGTANADEIEFVDTYLRLLEHRVPVPVDFELKKDSIYIDIKHQLLESLAKSNEEATVRAVRPLRSYWWAAASVAVFLLAGGYVFFKNYRETKAPAVVALADLPPGKNGAVLTLANGRQVLLDSMNNGEAVAQTGARMQNGALLYDSAATNTPQGNNTVYTPKGRQFQIVLPDGTKVWLNAASSLTYPVAFSKEERLVKVSGEAYFEVSQEAHRPFKVKVNDRTEIQVLGTSFNINAYYDEAGIYATLLNGSIKVVNGERGRQLRPGQQGVIGAGSRDVTVQNVNTENVVAWKNGSFAFVDADIESVMRQLSRWYDITVTYEGEIPQGKFSGEIDRSLTLTQVLKGLAITRIHYQLLPGNKLMIRP